MVTNSLPDVYTVREVASAAGVTESKIRDLLAGGAIRSVADALPGTAESRWQQFLTHEEAVRVVRAIRAGDLLEARDAGGPRRLLITQSARPRTTTLPLLVSTSLHVLVISALIVISTLGLTSADEKTEAIQPEAAPVRMVYLAIPGPGGGGGGGGMKMRTPPPKAQRQGPQKMSSPIPARRLPPPATPPPLKPEPPPPPLEAKTLPPVMAPVRPVAADPSNQEGVMKEMPKETPPSQGAGTGGGTGSGQGTGLGEGTGSGIGPGEGGGIGGGPYRPGSGVDPPRLLKEVRADYTDQARRASLEGEVVLEIVVRRDGSVGDVRMLKRLGSGLDQRAVDAVRQWRFAPARLKGTPVDVIVEVAVEFRLR
jgi:protein TonB